MNGTPVNLWCLTRRTAENEFEKLMQFLQRTTTGWLLITLIAFCTACTFIGLYLRAIRQPIPPLVDINQKQPEFYWPIFHTYSPAQKAHVLDGEFVIVNTVDHLPENLKSAFSHLAGMHDFAMANPGEKYQVTDVIIEEGLPDLRLLFAGISRDKYFIHYEEGGIGHSYHLAVFAIDSEGKVKFLWGGPGFRGAKDLKQLRTMVAAGVFKDDQAYSW
jgi:hypothetical protein